MFDFLTGGKANITITLDREFKPYYPGETVQGTITIEGQKDLKVREGRVVVLCREEYECRVEGTRTDSDGHTYSEEYSSRETDEQEIHRQVLISEGTVAGGSIQNYEFAVVIPHDARPTWDGGRIVAVKWLVKGTLDRKMAADTEAEAEILVFAPMPGKTTGPGEFGHSKEPEEAELAFVLPGKEWVLGETITGQLLVRPRKTFEVSEIRVELVRLEYVPRNRGNQHLEEITIKVAGKTRLEPGQELTLPFSLNIPVPRPTTGQTGYSSVTWFLKGVLARSLREDTRVEEEVFIYGARPA